MKRPGPRTFASGSSDADPTVRISPVCNRLRHLSAEQGKAAAAEQGNLSQEMSKAAQKALPTLMKGKGTEQEVGDWLIVTRPVRALKTSCLKCHQGAKLGDTLGALAYVVSKKTFAVALPSPGAAPTAPVSGGF